MLTITDDGVELSATIIELRQSYQPAVSWVHVARYDGYVPLFVERNATTELKRLGVTAG